MNTREQRRKVLTAILNAIVFASPTVAMVIQIFRATSEDGYRDNPLVTDPGRKRIRIYDQLVLAASFMVGVFIFFNSNLFDVATWSGNDDNLVRLKVIATALFPQITGGWFPTLLWSGVFLFLRFYDSKREGIIRTVNEKAKVW